MTSKALQLNIQNANDQNDLFLSVRMLLILSTSLILLAILAWVIATSPINIQNATLFHISPTSKPGLCSVTTTMRSKVNFRELSRGTNEVQLFLLDGLGSYKSVGTFMLNSIENNTATISAPFCSGASRYVGAAFFANPTQSDSLWSMFYSNFRQAEDSYDK